MAEVQDRLQADLTAVLDRSRTSATSRKLMREIEQALKKVTDGIQNFKELGIKMEAAEVSLAIDGLIEAKMLIQTPWQLYPEAGRAEISSSDFPYRLPTSEMSQRHSQTCMHWPHCCMQDS